MIEKHAFKLGHRVLQEDVAALGRKPGRPLDIQQCLGESVDRAPKNCHQVCDQSRWYYPDRGCRFYSVDSAEYHLHDHEDSPRYEQEPGHAQTLSKAQLNAVYSKFAAEDTRRGLMPGTLANEVNDEMAVLNQRAQKIGMLTALLVTALVGFLGFFLSLFPPGEPATRGRKAKQTAASMTRT